MEVSKPQPDSAEDSIDDNFDDFGFKFLCDDVKSNKSTLSNTSNSSSSESAPYSRYAGNVKPINGFWVIKENPSNRVLKEPRLSSRSSQKTNSCSGKSELKSGYRKDTQYVPALPHFRHFVEHSIQSSNIGRKVCDTKLEVHEKKESIYFQKPWIGELKVRESPNLEVVYDTNKTCTESNLKKSDSFEFQAVDYLAENSKIDAGRSESAMELVKSESDIIRVNAVHNYSWQFSPRDPRINKDLPEKDGTVSHKNPMKYSPRDPRIRISHDQKVTIPPCKLEVHDIKKYCPRDPRIKRFHVTESPNMGQSSEDNHVSVSCNLPDQRNSEDSAERITDNFGWEEGQGKGDKYETLESQKTDKENCDTYIPGSFHDQNQSPSLTKLKISRVAHHKNMYVSSFCQETSPPRSVGKVDGGLEAENGGPPRSVEKVDGDLEGENEVRIAIEGPKPDVLSENDACKFNEKTERLTKLGEKYCQAKVVVRKLQDFDIHKLTKAIVDTGSQGDLLSTVDPQVSESLNREKAVAISKLHKKGKRRGPRLRKELVLFSKNIPAKIIEDEVISYQYAILPSHYTTSAVEPNTSDLMCDESIQSSQPKQDIISDISGIDCVKEEVHPDQRPMELLVHGEFASAGDSIQSYPGNVKATSPDQDTLNCIKDPHIDGNCSVEEESHGKYNDTLSTESSQLPSAQCPSDDDEKDHERASINISEDVDINNLKQQSETNVRLLSQFEMEMGEPVPLTESLCEKVMGIIDNSNIICGTQKVEEKEIDSGECLEKETQCASWQVNRNVSIEVERTKTEKPSCENHEGEIEASSIKDVDQSHKVDTHVRIVEEIKTAFQVNEKQVEVDIGILKEQSNVHTPALSFLLHGEDPLLQDLSPQKSNKRHPSELDTADHLKGTGGGKLDDISSLGIISSDQVSVDEHLPCKKLRIDGDKILQQEGKGEVATVSQTASSSFTTTDKKMGFYHKKYNRKKLKLPIGTKYLKNQLRDRDICTSTSFSSRADQNARKEHSASEMTPTKEITLIGNPHSPEDSISPVLDPVVAIEKLRYKLFAEAGVDLSKPSSSLFSGKFQRKLKKKSENELQHENETNFSTINRVLKFENTSSLNNEKLNDPGSQPCVKDKLGISGNVFEKEHTVAVKTAGEVQSFGNAHSPKTVQIDYKAFHYQRKYNSGDARKAEVQVEKRKLCEKNIKQSKRAKISLLAQKLTLRSVSKTTRVGYSKDGFVEKTIVRKQKPDAECLISSSYGDKTPEQPFAGNIETKKGKSRNEISRNNFAQFQKGKGKSVTENYSKVHVNINIKNELLPTGTQQFEDGLSNSNCMQHKSGSNDSSMEFNNHSKINKMEEAENEKQLEELIEPDCIKIDESVNMGQVENINQVNIKTDNVDTGAHECDEKEQCKGDLDDGDKKSSDKRESIKDPRKHSKPKQRPAKCVVCGHVFKTKELLKKHHPCRIKQTRTWSQKALRSRPNRVRKEPLPVLENKAKTTKKPRLLEGSMAHKKSKFKVVKGKTRRKVLQTIRELMEKRKPSHLPHMHILCEQLPENEQFLFQLGLLRKEKTLVDDLTCHSPPISSVIVRSDAIAVDDLKTSQNYFHSTKEGYSICEDEKSFPPILEKISSEFSEELSPLLTWTATVEVPECLDPPVLEPILVPETFSANQDSLATSNLRNLTTDSPSAKQLTERHFTDFIEEMPETVKEKIDILKQKGTSECILSAASFFKMKSMIKAVKSPNHSMNKNIRRHFTDAISDKDVSPSMLNTVNPLNADVTEENIVLREIPSGEITLAYIKDVLTLERENKFSKHSLMKLNKDLAVLLTGVQFKSGQDENDSSDDEHKNSPERISTVTTATNLTNSSASVEEHFSLEKIHSSCEMQCKGKGLPLEEGFTETNDLREPTISVHLGEMGEFKVIDQEIQSATCITDNIIRMLNSLEDKGKFAENMKNVLQLLAANLGIHFSEIIQGGNLNKEEEEGRLQNNKENVETVEVYRPEHDEQYSDLELVGHVSANGSKPSLEIRNTVSDGSERGNQPKKVIDQEVTVDSSFALCEKVSRAEDNDINRVLLLNANKNKEDSLREQVFDLLKNMVNRVENEEIKSIKFVDEVSRRADVTFELVGGNRNNLNLLHQTLSDVEQKDGRIILTSEAQIQNDSEGDKKGIGVFESLHEQLDDSKLFSEGRNEVDVVSFTTVDHSENDNPGDGVNERLSVNDRTENSKGDRWVPFKELELVPSTVVCPRSHSKESDMRYAPHMGMSKTQYKVCSFESENQDGNALVHENTYLDKEYLAFQVMDGSEHFLEKSDPQPNTPVSHGKGKERWCPYTGYAMESDDTNEDTVAEGENNCQKSVTLSRKEHTDGLYNEACKGSDDDEDKFVVIPDMSVFHSTAVSNDEASRNENEIFQADQTASDTFIKNQSFNHDSAFEPISEMDSELNQMKDSVVSVRSEPTLNIVKPDSMDRTPEDESMMSKSGFFSTSEETCYKEYKILKENHSSSVAGVRSSETFKKREEEEYLDKEVVLSGTIKQDILKAKNMPVFKSDEHTSDAEDTAEPLYFDRQKDTRDECYQNDQDLTNEVQCKILHDQQMNHLSSKILHDQQMNHLSNADKGPAETNVDSDDQNALLVENNSIHATSNSSNVEFKSMKTSDKDDKKEDYVTKLFNTTVTTVGSHECEAVEERNMLHIPSGVGLDEVEKENLTIVKGVVSVDEQVNASVTEISQNNSENHNEDDSKSANSWETNSNQTVNVSKSCKPDATLHISKFQQELGERSSPVALRNLITGEHPIDRGNHEIEYNNLVVKADYVEYALKFSSEESHHQEVLDEHVEKESGIEQLLSPNIETSSFATASDVTATEITSYYNNNILGSNVEHNADIDKESVENTIKAETVLNEVSYYENKREFNDTVSEGSESDLKGGKEDPACLTDVDKMETKSLDYFTCDRIVTSRYEPEAEPFHAKNKRPEEFKNNEQREDSTDRSGDVKEITYFGNGNDLIISSCDQQSFPVAVGSENILPSCNINSEVEISEKNQPTMAYESHSLSLTNQVEIAGERDLAQKKLYTQGIDSLESTGHNKKDEIMTCYMESNKMCCLYSGDCSVQSPAAKESESDDNEGFDLKNKQDETSKEKLTEYEAGTKKHKSYTTLCQDSVAGEDFHEQSSDAPKDEFNHAVPSIDSHGEDFHADLILHQGMEQVDIVVDSYFDSYKDVPNSIHKPIINSSVKSDVGEEVNDSSDIVSDSKLLSEENHHAAETVMSNSAGTEFGSGFINEHKYQTDTTLSDSLKNEKEFGLFDVFKIPTQEIIMESETVNPEVVNTKYKLNTSNVDDETVFERENTNIQGPKHVYDIAFNTDPGKEIQNASLKPSQTGLSTRDDKTMLLKKDCDVQSKKEFHKKPIVPKLLSSGLPHPVSLSSQEIKVGHATHDPSTSVGDIVNNDDDIKSTQYMGEPLIGSESPVFPEQECSGTHDSHHFSGNKMLQDVQQQTTGAALEIDNNATSETEVNSQHECSDSEEIPKLA